MAVTCVALVGGRGKRMAPSYTAKPNLRIGAHTFLEWSLSSVGYDRLVLQGDVDLELTDPHSCGYVCHDRLQCSGPAVAFLWALRNCVGDDDQIICVNADQWLDWSWSHFCDFATRCGADIVLPVTHRFPRHWSVVQLDGNGLVVNIQAGDMTRQRYPWGLCGVTWFRSAKIVLRAMERPDAMIGGEAKVEEVVQFMLDEATALSYPVPGFVHLGTANELEEAKKMKGVPW